MRNDDFIGQQFCWFTGVVEDIADPEKINRVKVRCHGYHDSDTAILETKDLPWAIIMMPSTSQSDKGYGRTHELEIGSWVVGFFRDGISAQDPLVMGSVSTQSPAVSEHGWPTGDLPLEAFNADNYPNNKVYKSKAGHIVEFDNGVWNEDIVEVIGKAAVTGGIALDGTVIEGSDEVLAVAPVAAHRSGERIHVKHVNGTEVQIDDENNLMVYVEDGGNLTIDVRKGNTTITTEEGDTKIITNGDTNIESTGDCTIKSTGRSRYTSGKEVTIQAVDKVRIM